MQKKILALVLSLALALGLCACGQSVGGDTAASDTAAASTAASAAESAAEAADTTSGDAVKVGFIYIGNESEAYTANFIRAEEAIAAQFGDQVETMAKYDVGEAEVEDPLKELISAGCSVIFTTSYGYESVAKEVAAANPDVQFYQATGDNAQTDPIDNYHTYMGHIYQGRYVAGIAAGMKLQEMIDAGSITEDQALVGYVAAYPYAEVISGYTAFLMGVRSIVPSATMEVQYANSWGDYDTEKTMATALIEDGCVIISQHSDTEGPVKACEDAFAAGKEVYAVSYNADMTDIGPNTCLISSRQDYSVFEISAVQAYLDGTTMPADNGAGYEAGWVATTPLNTAIAAEGTQEKIDEAEKAFTDGTMKATDVFVGPYVAVNPFDESSTIDLTEGFDENGSQSAPAFNCVITDLITVK